MKIKDIPQERMFQERVVKNKYMGKSEFSIIIRDVKNHQSETGGMKQKLHFHSLWPVVFEHAQKYTTFKDIIVDFVHWLNKLVVYF